MLPLKHFGDLLKRALDALAFAASRQQVGISQHRQCRIAEHQNPQSLPHIHSNDHPWPPGIEPENHPSPETRHCHKMCIASGLALPLQCHQLV